MIFVLRNGTGNIIEYNYSGKIGGASVCNHDFHTETIVMWAMNDTDIRFNFFTEAPSSGGIVRNGLSDTTSEAIRIYGNVIGNGGNFVCVNYGKNSNWRIFNNTFYNGVNGPLADGGAQSWTYLTANNVAYNFSYGYPPGDYSSFYHLGESQCTSNARSYTSAVGFIVRMPIDCDYPDSNYYRDPFVNSAALDFRLSGPEDAGADACAVAGITCDAAKPYNKDMLGNTRTNWSRGAFEYIPPGDTTPPAAPMGLMVR